MYKRFSIIMLAVALSSCGTPQQKASALEENKEAKSLLEGIWLDDNTETALLRVKGDTLFYADAATAPVAFKIIGDSLITYGARTNGYKIEKQEEHIFWFHSAVGDVIRLHKSDTENDSLAFIHTREIPVYNEVIKKDSVVTYDNVRYRGYVYINPSKIIRMGGSAVASPVTRCEQESRINSNSSQLAYRKLCLIFQRIEFLVREFVFGIVGCGFR